MGAADLVSPTAPNFDAPYAVAPGKPDRMASRLEPAFSFGDVEGLSNGVVVPSGPGARREVNRGHGHGRVCLPSGSQTAESEEMARLRKQWREVTEEARNPRRAVGPAPKDPMTAETARFAVGGAGERHQ